MSKETLKPYVLVVEDEDAIALMLRYNLEKEGFEVKVVEEGDTALYEIEERKPDIVLLDWMIPEISGMDVCRRLRSQEETRTLPVIMLTARGEELDRLKGLDSGADDYIVKPFSPKELIARIRAVLRRSRPVLESKCLAYAGITLDIQEHRVEFDGKLIQLGPTEFRLLAYLLEHPRRVFSRDQLLNAVWGQDAFLDSRTVDVHIRRVRKALATTSPGLEEVIHTIRAAGYKLDSARE
jgi:two-component system, OmpR family, phosphate regulon response regulator PhoB